MLQGLLFNDTVNGHVIIIVFAVVSVVHFFVIGSPWWGSEPQSGTTPGFA
jgi:hypothetical protein